MGRTAYIDEDEFPSWIDEYVFGDDPLADRAQLDGEDYSGDRLLDDIGEQDMFGRTIW